MALTGTFAVMPFPDLLQWLGQSGRSGKLVVQVGFEERFFRIERGTIAAVGAEDPRASDLVRLLLARGLVSEDMLPRILADQAQTGQALRSVVVDNGYVAAAALASATRAHARDLVLTVFLWDEGSFTLFGDAELGFLGDTTWDLEIDPPLAVNEVLIEAMRRIDEWHRIGEVLSSDYTVLHALGRPSDLPAVIALADLGEPTSLGELCLRLDRPRFEILEELYKGWQRGMVALDSGPDQLARRAGSAPADALVSAGQALLDEQQFEEASALLRSALSLDPLHHDARLLLHRLHAEQLDDLYRQFPPYRVPFATRDEDALARLPLSGRERFLLHRIDGHRDVAALTVVTPVGELATLRTLRKLTRLGAIGLR